MADHTDHDAIISEKLKMLKISSLKAEQKQSLVIMSPLACIMDFKDLGISAAKLRCDEKTLEEIDGGKCRVIFGSTEAVLDERFRKNLKDSTKPFHRHVKLIVVDERNTVETW